MSSLEEFWFCFVWFGFSFCLFVCFQLEILQKKILVYLGAYASFFFRSDLSIYELALKK